MVEVNNRKAHYDYFIDREIEAGIELKGTEIKSIRKGSVSLNDSYAYIRNGEIYLLNTYIAKYDEGNRFNHDERITRKLLMHKAEIKKLSEEVKLQGVSLIPLKLYFKGNKVKVLIGVCRGKHNYDKRETIKQRDIDRENRKMVY
jgi:SsrA-binding protein